VSHPCVEGGALREVSFRTCRPSRRSPQMSTKAPNHEERACGAVYLLGNRRTAWSPTHPPTRHGRSRRRHGHRGRRHRLRPRIEAMALLTAQPGHVWGLCRLPLP
jgi:hypothetical protein